ncbi:MAG TPA: UrcA family protein [Rhizomicrobium sp.]|nr:UrcA family protein [Rhizomicrobium sp.]
MTRIFIPAALFALLAVPPAFAADSDVDHVVVRYGDLDLHSAAGRTELKARLDNAAATLCHTRWMAKTPDSELSVGFHQMIYRACVGRLANRALARIDATHQLGMMALN